MLQIVLIPPSIETELVLLVHPFDILPSWLIHLRTHVQTVYPVEDSAVDVRVESLLTYAQAFLSAVLRYDLVRGEPPSEAVGHNRFKIKPSVLREVHPLP